MNVSQGVTPQGDQKNDVDIPPTKLFCPENMTLVSVLNNNTRGKCLFLHTRVGEDTAKDAVVILQKSSFPTDALALKKGSVINHVDENSVKSAIKEDSDSESAPHNQSSFPRWQADEVMANDIYYRFTVKNGLELVNDVDMTVIYPANENHLKKYAFSGCHIIQETPKMYRDIVVPFLSITPKDLTWVDNIVTGKAEKERVIYSHEDSLYGFTLVLDYKWDESKIRELHCLAIAHSGELTCIRDLRSEHVPMLKRILQKGRSLLSEKYSRDVNHGESNDNVLSVLSEDQIMAYLHYPPTFYRLHVHFVHVDASEDGGTRTGRAHLLDEVIRNLELYTDYYCERTLTIYLHDNSPMLESIRSADKCRHKDERDAVE